MNSNSRTYFGATDEGGYHEFGFIALEWLYTTGRITKEKYEALSGTKLH
jgi:hypothetical protein